MIKEIFVHLYNTLKCYYILLTLYLIYILFISTIKMVSQNYIYFLVECL